MAKTDGTKTISRRTRLVPMIGLLVIAAGIVAVIVVRQHKADQRLQVLGSVSILESDKNTQVNINDIEANCTGTGNFSDIARGTPVRIIDSSGDVTGPVPLGYGQKSSDERRCTFYFGIEPRGGQRYYDVKVGARPAIRYTQDDLHDLEVVYQ